MTTSFTQNMEKFMLTNKKLVQCSFKKKVRYEKEIFQRREREEESKKEKKNEKEKGGVFYPVEKDSLFWCFYILKHGKEAYDEIQPSINIVTERKNKIDYVDSLRKNKKTIKGYKIAPLVNIENFLVNEPCIDMATFFALCILEDIPLLYVYRKTYYELTKKTEIEGEGETKRSFVLYKTENQERYGCEWDASLEQISHIKATYFQLEQMNKPIRAFSAYKANDLVEIGKRLDINVLNKDGKKRPNKELYEAIVQYF
jgi:hypothetical protein